MVRAIPLRYAGFGVAALIAVGACGVSQELYNTRTTELDRCQSELTRTQGDLTNMRQEVDHQAGAQAHAVAVEMNYLKLKQDLNATEKQLEELRHARERAEQRSEVYRNLLARLKSMIEAKTIAVEIRKGKMLVKLGDQILFDAGKIELKPDGQQALRQIAAALKEIPDRDFLVAGHTDNVPIKNSPYKSNWDLSAARAVTVVRFLQAEGVDPTHLAAAGYSEFDRLVDNATAEERAKNRRIEIVVMPQLDELPSVAVPAEPAPPDGGVSAPDAGPAPAPPATPPPPAPALPRP
jgi:chemotaxis protein MotB